MSCCVVLMAQGQQAEQLSGRLFPYPMAPDTCSTLESRCNYIITHFWEGYDISKEIYGEYELIVFREQTSPLIVVYMEKNGTYIAITGQLSMEQIHSIIDSLVVDESI